MKHLLASLLFLFVAVRVTAQSTELFRISSDSSTVTLTVKGASLLAALPLKCILQEFPNKTNHTSVSDSDHVLKPSQLHPSFYGCFDWHSCVHGHWMLVRLLRQFPGMPEAVRIRQVLHTTLTPDKIRGELRYFSLPLTASWERTYGWAWVLQLDRELQQWKDADAAKWREALKPLTEKIVDLWMKFLPKQTYANRTGVHPNTAFGLVFALEYARQTGATNFEKAILTAARHIFGADTNAPALWEPNGSDFLSPVLEEADLMRRVLSPHEFTKWFHAFLPMNSLKHLTVLPVVSDRSDLQIVHLDGLCFSRSWCMKGLAQSLPATDPRKKILQASAIRHLTTALPHVVSGEYGGEHWLASFAVYALLNAETK